MKLGVVIWVEGLMLKFRINEGVRVEKGQLVKVDEGSVRYVARVYSFKPEALLTHAEVARISHRKSMGEELDLLESPLRYYDTALAMLVAQLDSDGGCHGPTGSPRLFSDVESLDELDLAQLSLDVGDIDVGFIRVGHRIVNSKVKIDGSKAFPHHLLVCSITGGGKTNLGKVLAWNVAKAPSGTYSLIIFDTEGEYFDGGGLNHMGLAHSIYTSSKLLYITNKVSTVCRLSFKFSYDGHKFERNIAAHPLEISWSQLHPEDICQTGELTPPQESLLWMVWRRHSDGWLKKLMDSDDELLYRELERMVQKVTIAVAKRKLRRMLGDRRIFKPNFCSTDLISSILEAVSRGRVVLIDLPDAPEEQEKLLNVMVARRVFEHYERMKKEAPEAWAKLPTVLIVVEEAHRYLSKASLEVEGGRRENVFSTISKRGRKYRVGLCCITQMPGELNEPIIRQQLTKIILPLPTKPDYSKVIHYSPFLERSGQEVKTLDRGEALVVSPPSGFKFAVPVKIHAYEDLVKEVLAEAMLEANGGGFMREEGSFNPHKRPAY